MSMMIRTDPPPLRQDESGALRVGESRVLLELVIRAFQDGATPEAIVQRYPTTTLADVYAVVAYALRHQEEIEAYLADRERRAGEVRERLEQRQGDLGTVRRRLLARREG
jgi:uncharacterized protein (DUF433 family)